MIMNGSYQTHHQQPPTLHEPNTSNSCSMGLNTNTKSVNGLCNLHLLPVYSQYLIMLYHCHFIIDIYGILNVDGRDATSAII